MQHGFFSSKFNGLRRPALLLAACAAWPMAAAAQAPAVSAATPVVAPVAAPRPAQPAMNEAVAAIINDDIITTYDLQQRMRLIVLTTGVQPTQEALQQIEQDALGALVDERLELQELQRVQKAQEKDSSNKSSLIATDKEVDDEVANLAKQNNLTYAQLKASFAAAGVDINSLRDEIRMQISWQRLVGGRYGSSVKIADDQVNTALKMLSEAASQPQYLVGEIFIDAARAGGQQQAIEGAQQLIAQLQKGAPFAAVARQFSGALTAANGGDAGWISASQEPPEVAKALEGLRPGQLSGPIPVTDGVYIIYLRDRRAASNQTLVNLKQLAIRVPKDATEEQVKAAEATLANLRAQAKGCSNLDALASKAKGVVVADLGETQVTDLSGPFKTAAMTLQPDQISQPIRSEVGVHLVAVCGKRTGGADIPTKDQIENRLFSEELAEMSKRYLRDLKNSADIETR